VKQLTTSFLIALLVHGLILTADISWLKGFSLDHVPAKSVTISLSVPRPEKILKHRLQPIVKPPQDRILPLPPKKIAYQPKIEETVLPQTNTPPDTVKPKAAVIPVLPKSSLKALTKTQSKKDAEPVTRDASPSESDKIPLSNPQVTQTSSNQEGSQNQDVVQAARPQNASIQTAAIDKQVSSTAIQLARPLYKQNPSPKYPRRARKLGYQGVVILEVLVNDNGKVNDIKILESSGHKILDKAAVSSVKRWMFEPGTRNGEKVKMWVRIPIRFKLN
jgi:protein TonB